MPERTTTANNFAFLLNYPKIAYLYVTASNAEELYANEKYGNELESIRKVAENVAIEILKINGVKVSEYSNFNYYLSQIRHDNLADKKIINLFYEIKKLRNDAAHSMNDHTKDEGYRSLKNIYNIIVWFINFYLDSNAQFNKFVEPQYKVDYQTAERKIIYIQTADNSQNKWPQYQGLEKIGDTSISDIEQDNHPNSPDLRKAANLRISSYMKTAGIPYDLQWAELAYRKDDHTWFRDYDVHRVLVRSGIKKEERGSGKEWFKTDLDTAKKAIEAVKTHKKSIDDLSTRIKPIQIKLRPEQQAAVEKTKIAFKNYDGMLWNAKMRFGKTLTALELVKEEKYQKVLIMTHRPVVDEGWFEDFKKIGMPKAGYLYGSRKEGEDFAYLINSEKPFVYFASLQDLRGSKDIGGTIDKNHELLNTTWDLIIIDEAHEGTLTELAQNVMNKVITPGYTKELKLSGTPFNLMDQFEEDQVYTLDYTMEQKAKKSWSVEYPDKVNPYESLPKVSMYTFEMKKNFNDSRFDGDDKQAFNFKEFFRVNDSGKFVYEDKVKQFLDNITTPDQNTNYPFSTKQFREQLKHTLWILPGVKEANALENLLQKHPVFGVEYNIVNVVRDGDNEGIASESDVQRVKAAMNPDPAVTKTITLTVRKMTTGVTIKPWTGVIFLSNTSSTMQYLQAAFRAQTPYSSATFGEKANCYIFDFAPDRALTIMAESAQLRTGVGKLTSSSQKEKMNELMNFLPIIGETGQGMKPFKVDSLLAKVKRVYAERAVRSGFDDDSLYSDALLKLEEADLEEFNNLRAIVGTTKSEKKPVKIDINRQGLSDEEYEKALKAKDKSRQERSPEEQAAINKMKLLKKQRKTMISILRSISIRIPLMIYGMDLAINEDVNIQKFIRNVDDQSWHEFMPKGVTKEQFQSFIKYYDQDVFIEASRIIRHKVKSYDKLDPIERTEKLAELFSTFKNPDKETVLTPWRVVNMQLGMTLGGYSFFDDKYQYETIDGSGAKHWIQTGYSDKVFNLHSHILEINAKTGLYPLYATMSIYYREYQKLNDRHAGKFEFGDQLALWGKILKNNIFVIAKTPMAKEITQRTLSGFRNLETNIKYIDHIVEDSRSDINQEAKKIKRIFNNMKFDVVIGNPPYQVEANGDRSGYISVYHQFMNLSYQLSNLSIMITPARFLFNAGSTPAAFNKQIINDKHFKLIYYEKYSDRVFPNTDIKGGIAISLYDKEKVFKPIKMFIPYNELNSIFKKVDPFLKSDNNLSSIMFPAIKLNLINLYRDFPEDRKKISSNGHDRRIPTNIFKLNSVHKKLDKNDFLIYGIENNSRVIRYINKDYIDKSAKNNIEKYKVILPKANGSGALGEKLSSPFICYPNTCYTYTFIGIGSFEKKLEADAVLKYVKSKFARLMLGILKVTQDNTPEKWKLVPLQDFTSNSDIDWSKSILEIDQQLYQKYNLSQDEISFIETKVQAMD